MSSIGGIYKNAWNVMFVEMRCLASPHCLTFYHHGSISIATIFNKSLQIITQCVHYSYIIRIGCGTPGVCACVRVCMCACVLTIAMCMLY